MAFSSGCGIQEERIHWTVGLKGIPWFLGILSKAAKEPEVFVGVVD